MSSLQLLVVGSDEGLADEVTAAVAARGAALVRRAEDVSRAVVLIRDRAPDVVIADLDLGAAELERLGEEIEGDAPQAVLLAAYAPGALEGAGATLLIDAVRGRVRDFLRRPISAPEFDGAWARHRAPRRLDAAPAGRITTFFGNKGGVGRSTLAVHTAALLSRRSPGRVLLVDASLQLGVCASALDLEAETTLVDAARQAARLDATLLRSLVVEHESGLALLAAPHDALEGADVDETAVARVLGVARRSYDQVIVDTGASIDGAALAVLDLSDTVAVVTSSLVPVVAGTAQLLDVLDRVGCPRERQRIVLNHAQPSFAGALRTDDVAARLDREVDAVVPFDKRALVALNVGVPSGGRLGGFRRAIEGLAEMLSASRAAERAS